jgi:hypothetical protein
MRSHLDGSITGVGHREANTPAPGVDLDAAFGREDLSRNH